MSITLNAKILLKRGIGDPGTSLDLSEPGFDTVNNKLYIGKGIGINAIPISMQSDVSVFLANYISNASLSNDFVWNGNNLEVSLGSVYGLNLLASNVSVGLAFASNVSLGLASISYATNSSVGLAFLTNASLGLAGVVDFTPYATNSSVGNAFLTNVSLGLVKTMFNTLLDVSIVDVSNNDYLRYNYTAGKWVNERTVDASLYFYTKTQVDASFALKTDINSSLGLYVKKSGDTMTGNLTLNSSLCVNGAIYVDNSLGFTGNVLLADGSTMQFKNGIIIAILK